MNIRFVNQLNESEQLFYCTGAGPKQRMLGARLLYAGLISAMVYIFAITGGSFKQLVIMQGIFVLWVIFSITFSQGRAEFSAFSIFAFLMIALALGSNLLVNHDNYDITDRSFAFAFAHVFGIIVFMLAALWAASNLQPIHILESIAWMLLPLIVLALATGWNDGENSRAFPFGVHPNWWGEVAFGFILCSLVLRRMMVKIFFIVFGVWLMITVQSRGALLAAMVSVMAYLVMQYRPFGKVAMKKFVIFCFMMLGCFVFVTVTGLWSPILDIVESKILLLNNPYRGLDSGLTGRLAGWWEAIEIFMENPVFGQGFDTLTEVHNGFLRWAGEGGILLLGVMSLLMISAMVRSWRRRNAWAFATLLGIMIYMITYPRSLNLNLVGMLFFLALFSWKGKQNQNSNANLHGC